MCTPAESRPKSLSRSAHIPPPPLQSVSSHNKGLRQYLHLTRFQYGGIQLLPKVPPESVAESSPNPLPTPRKLGAAEPKVRICQDLGYLQKMDAPCAARYTHQDIDTFQRIEQSSKGHVNP